MDLIEPSLRCLRERVSRFVAPSAEAQIELRLERQSCGHSPGARTSGVIAGRRTVAWVENRSRTCPSLMLNVYQLSKRSISTLDVDVQAFLQLEHRVRCCRRTK